MITIDNWDVEYQTDEHMGNVIQGVISEVLFLGEARERTIMPGENSLRLHVHPTKCVEKGETMNLSLAPDKCHAPLDRSSV